MKRSTRLLVAGVAIELLLAGICLWLLNGFSSGRLQPTTNAADATATITSTMGGVMGALAGVLAVAWFVMRRRGL